MTTDRQQKVAKATIIATLIAAPAEGIRQVAYYDPPGILTVCRGHTGPDVQPGKKYSLAECDAFLTDDMRRAVAQVDRCAPDAPVEVLAAFSDAAFNLGPVIACDPSRSTAAKRLQARQWAQACDELLKWDKARVAGVMVALPGLTKRRHDERDLCMKGAAG